MTTAPRARSSVLPSVLALNNYHYVRGGSERYALELARLLAAHGHEVVEISTEDPRNSPAQGPARFVAPNDLERPGPLDLLRFRVGLRNGVADHDEIRARIEVPRRESLEDADAGRRKDIGHRRIRLRVGTGDFVARLLQRHR